MTSSQSIFSNTGLRLYLGSTALSGVAFAMQQLLLSWILIGILELPAGQVGMIQAAAGIPGLFFMLLGGARADGSGARQLLLQVYSLAPIVPAFLIVVVAFDKLHVWSVLLWALGMSVVISYSSPAQQALLNGVAGANVQKAVSAATAIGYFVQMIGLSVAGTIEQFGLIPVLTFQALCIGIGALVVRRLSAADVTAPKAKESAIKKIREGLKVAFNDKTLFHVLGINFASSIFNAGAFITVFPFIVKRIYDGNALLLSGLMIVFFAGATASNFLMIRIMPLAKPGRVFLLMQLSRMVILGLIWIQPSLWLMTVATIAWGFNMGITTTLARTIVQESAQPQFRGRVMSVYSLGLLGSAPLGAIVLGWIIDAFGTLNALIPAMCLSVALFLVGIFFTNVYQYESPSQSA